MLILLCRSTMVLKEIAGLLTKNPQEIKKNVLYNLGEQDEIEILAISTFDDKLLKSIIDNFLELLGTKNVKSVDLNPYLKTIELLYWWLNLGGFRKKKMETLMKIILTELNDLKDNLKENITKK